MSHLDRVEIERVNSEVFGHWLSVCSIVSTFGFCGLCMYSVYAALAVFSIGLTAQVAIRRAAKVYSIPAWSRLASGSAVAFALFWVSLVVSVQNFADLEPNEKYEWEELYGVKSDYLGSRTACIAGFPLRVVEGTDDMWFARKDQGLSPGQVVTLFHRGRVCIKITKGGWGILLNFSMWWIVAVIGAGLSSVQFVRAVATYEVWLQLIGVLVGSIWVARNSC